MLKGLNLYFSSSACLALCNPSETVNFKANTFWNSLYKYFFVVDFNFVGFLVRTKILKEHVKRVKENKMQIEQYNYLNIGFQWKLFKNKFILYLCIFYIKLRLLPRALFAVAGVCNLERVQSAQINVINPVLCGTVTVSLSFSWAVDASRIPQAWAKSQYLFHRVSIKG